MRWVDGWGNIYTYSAHRLQAKRSSIPIGMRSMPSSRLCCRINRRGIRFVCAEMLRLLREYRCCVPSSLHAQENGMVSAFFPRPNLLGSTSEILVGRNAVMRRPGRFGEWWPGDEHKALVIKVGIQVHMQGGAKRVDGAIESRVVP